MNVKALKGFKDILPDETPVWRRIEAVAREVFARFGFEEIRVPVVEKTELFVRSIGEATDIVEKEMYTFADRNGVSVTLRPEGTAPVLRAFVEHGLHVRKPVQRLYTIGPMFRYERPQKGRLRQFHQVSAEVLGGAAPFLDAEVMAAAWSILEELGVDVSLEINSLGCAACRPAFRQELVAFLQQRLAALCPDCQRRTATNPLRVLDCKNEACRRQLAGAPSILDALCSGCRSHFHAVRQGLDLLHIPYRENPFMVRGLDYYCRTTFELVTDALGAQSAVGAGGRYDGLLARLGGPDLPGIGFGMGLERLTLLCGGQEASGRDCDLFVAALGDRARSFAFALVHRLRRSGLRALMDTEGKGLKSQMKQAARASAAWTLIVGDNEMEEGEAVLRDMRHGEQAALPLTFDDPLAAAAAVVQRLGVAAEA